MIKLCGIDHHFVEAGTAIVKLHNAAGVRMFQSMAGFKETTMPDSFVFTPVQALFGSLTVDTTRQQFVPSLIFCCYHLNGFTSRLIANIIEHEAWYVTKLRSVHEVFFVIIVYCISTTKYRFNQSFIKPLEQANPPIIPVANLPTFFLSTIDGYTEILLAHQTVLKRLFEIQTLDPLIEAIHVFEPMLDCVTQLREVYSDYFLDLADRRHVLEMTEMTFMSITDVCTLSAERRIWTDDDQIKAMFRPHHMDIVPITLKDLTDVPLHYCEFLGTALHKFLNILNISASSAALHNVVFFLHTSHS